MPGFDGTGPRGMGPMTGGGRGFCSPWGWSSGPVYGGYGGFRGNMFDYPYYGMRPQAFSGARFYPQMTQQQEIDLLKNEAQGLKDQLEHIESRIRQIEKQT